MKHLITILILTFSTTMYSQFTYILDESFDNSLSEDWIHCSGNWGDYEQWSAGNGYLGESSGPYFGRVLNGLLIPSLDLTTIENPILEIEYALGELDSLTELSIYYTTNDSCITIWDNQIGGYLLENWELISSFYKTNDIDDMSWTPNESDFQTITMELDSLQLGENARIGIVSDYKNFSASANWFINSVKIYGESPTNNSIHQLADKSIDLFPNPSNQTINIVLKDDQFVSKILIFNTAGQVLSSFGEFEKTYQFDVSNYSEGVYILQVVLPNEIITKKFTVN